MCSLAVFSSASGTGFLVSVPNMFGKVTGQGTNHMCQEPGAFPEHIPDDYDAARWFLCILMKEKNQEFKSAQGSFASSAFI